MTAFGKNWLAPIGVWRPVNLRFCLAMSPPQLVEQNYYRLDQHDEEVILGSL